MSSSKVNIEYQPLINADDDKNGHDIENGKVKLCENNTEISNSSFMAKIASAFFYASSSLLITVVNKTVLTSFHFPSILCVSLGQLTANIMLLFIAKMWNLIKLPPLTMQTLRNIFPLPLFFMGNMILGLGSTQALSLPMFSALRHVSILMTMFLELWILGTRPPKAMQLSVFAMVGSTFIAAIDDLSFNFYGYVYIMCNNLMSASNYVYIKKTTNSTELGNYGLVFYNSLVVIFPTLIIAILTGELKEGINYIGWSDAKFVIQFLLSCVMGFFLTFSMVLCTNHNSALTTTVVGAIKNVLTTYVGMFIGNDYFYSFVNFLGINISVFASLVYSFIAFKTKQVTGSENENGKLAPNSMREKTSLALAVIITFMLMSVSFYYVRPPVDNPKFN